MATYSSDITNPTPLAAGEAVSIINGAVVTITNGAWAAAVTTNVITITDGELLFQNTSTTVTYEVPIATINVGTTFGKLTFAGNFKQIGTGTGAASQTVTNYSTVFSPGVWVESGSGTGIYDRHLNLKSPDDAQFSAPFTTVGITDLGHFFEQSAGSSTMTFGDGVNGTKPISGAKIIIPNITCKAISVNSAINVNGFVVADSMSFGDVPIAPLENASITITESNVFTLSTTYGSTSGADLVSLDGVIIKGPNGYAHPYSLFMGFSTKTLSITNSFEAGYVQTGLFHTLLIDNINHFDYSPYNPWGAMVYSPGAYGSITNVKAMNSLFSVTSRQASVLRISNIEVIVDLTLSGVKSGGGSAAYYPVLAVSGADVVLENVFSRTGGQISGLALLQIEAGRNYVIRGIDFPDFVASSVLFIGALPSGNFAIQDITIASNTDFLSVDASPKAISGISISNIYVTSPIALVDPAFFDQNLQNISIPSATEQVGTFNWPCRQFYTGATTGMLDWQACMVSDIDRFYSYLGNGSLYPAPEPSFYVPDASSYVDVTWPFKVYGVTGLTDVAVTHTGMGGALPVIEYSIDNGDGYGAWTLANATNLLAETVSAVDGFFFKARVGADGANTGNVSSVRFMTTVDKTVLSAIVFSSITIQNLVAGTSYYVFEAADPTNVLASGVSTGTDTVAAVEYWGEDMLVTIRARKYGYKPYTINGVVSASGLSVYVIQIADTIAA